MVGVVGPKDVPKHLFSGIRKDGFDLSLADCHSYRNPDLDNRSVRASSQQADGRYAGELYVEGVGAEFEVAAPGDASGGLDVHVFEAPPVVPGLEDTAAGQRR